jgi:hypothetical protein
VKNASIVGYAPWRSATFVMSTPYIRT